ncbi:hypothetical protein T492DRAFT_963980 [Pavlovales sp. CCMP2436]|nr:hypothetical protein T492DRAFT_963980 [Pavlovales sp. CCMP2436]
MKQKMRFRCSFVRSFVFFGFFWLRILAPHVLSQLQYLCLTSIPVNFFVCLTSIAYAGFAST